MKKAILFAAVLLMNSLALGQSKQQGMPDAVTPDATVTCQSTFSSGSLSTLLKFCVTANGNITQFESPQNIEYIAHGDFAEGYGFCDKTTNVGYYDYAVIDSANWNAPVRTQPGGPNTFPLKIVRTTTDGIWTLTQTFTRNTGERFAKVTMALKNNTAINRNVELMRYADVDAPFGPTEFTNRFDYTFSAGLGYVLGNFGLALQNGTLPAAHSAFAQNTSNGPDPCNPFANVATTPFTGDGSVVMWFPLTVPKTASKTVAAVYRPF
jgi:hypothetical protein